MVRTCTCDILIILFLIIFVILEKEKGGWAGGVGERREGRRKVSGPEWLAQRQAGMGRAVSGDFPW